VPTAQRRSKVSLGIRVLSDPLINNPHS